jgi:hypothetical protein
MKRRLSKETEKPNKVPKLGHQDNRFDKLITAFQNNNADFIHRKWNPECEKAVEERTTAFLNFKKDCPIDFDHWHDLINKYAGELSLNEKKAIRDYITKVDVPIWDKNEEFNLSKFEKLFVTKTEELVLGKQMPLAVLNLNHIFAADVIEYRLSAVELGGQECRVTYEPGHYIYVIKLSEKVFRNKFFFFFKKPFFFL